MPNDIDFSIWNPQVFSALGSPAIEYAQGIEVVIVGPTSIRLRTSDVFVDLILTGPLFEPYTSDILGVCVELYEHVFLRRFKHQIGSVSETDAIDFLFLLERDKPYATQLLKDFPVRKTELSNLVNEPTFPDIYKKYINPTTEVVAHDLAARFNDFVTGT